MSTQELIQLLDRQRKAVLAIPGTVGVAVGLPMEGGRSNDPVVQVFVDSKHDVRAVKSEARKILRLSNIEVIVSGEMVPLA